MVCYDMVFMEKMMGEAAVAAGMNRLTLTYEQLDLRLFIIKKLQICKYLWVRSKDGIVATLPPSPTPPPFFPSPPQSGIYHLPASRARKAAMTARVEFSPWPAWACERVGEGNRTITTPGDLW